MADPPPRENHDRIGCSPSRDEQAATIHMDKPNLKIESRVKHVGMPDQYHIFSEVNNCPFRTADTTETYRWGAVCPLSKVLVVRGQMPRNVLASNSHL